MIYGSQMLGVRSWLSANMDSNSGRGDEPRGKLIVIQ